MHVLPKGHQGCSVFFPNIASATSVSQDGEGFDYFLFLMFLLGSRLTGVILTQNALPSTMGCPLPSTRVSLTKVLPSPQNKQRKCIRRAQLQTECTSWSRSHYGIPQMKADFNEHCVSKPASSCSVRAAERTSHLRLLTQRMLRRGDLIKPSCATVTELQLCLVRIAHCFTGMTGSFGWDLMASHGVEVGGAGRSANHVTQLAGFREVR